MAVSGPLQPPWDSPASPTFPDRCLILVAGLPGAGKSTFCRTHFSASQIVSWDDCRIMLADRQEGELGVWETDRLTLDIAETRLRLGRLAVIDGALLGERRREQFRQLAVRYECPCYLVLIDTPVERAIARGLGRAERPVGPESVRDCTAAIDALRVEARGSLYAGAWRFVT